METEVEYNVSSPEENLDEVLEKIKDIAKKSADGDCIYRGEPECYDKVSSNLYREYEADIKAENFNIAVVQKEILKEAREYNTHKMDDTEILTELQHYGGKTNLIDFTTDYLVALFFACDGNRDKPGRVILLQKRSETYEVILAPRTIPRAGVQKSTFVQAPKGFVVPDKIVYIPAELKGAMLDYLRKHHDISTRTVYNDLHGFIEKQKLHKRAYATFHKGFTFQDRADSAKTEAERQQWYSDAITHYTAAIELNPENVRAYNNRGIAYRRIGNLDAAIADYSRAIYLNPENARAYNNRGVAYRHRGDFDAAIVDYSRAIELNPKNAGAYCNRGEAWLHLKEWEKAKADLTTAKDMGNDIIKSFHNAYESVEDFEAKLGVKVPEDIAALLQRK